MPDEQPARPSPSGRSAWDRKKRATRQALRQAAVELVAERGLSSVTVEAIAEAAEVSPRTFFNYFPTKEDAVIGWDPAVLAEMVGWLRARPIDEPPLAALRAALLEALSPHHADHRELLERLQIIRADPHLLAHQVLRFGDTERQLVAALAERRGTDPVHDHHAALVVAIALAASRAALMAWCDLQGRRPLVEMLADNFDTVGSGLAESPSAASAGAGSPTGGSAKGGSPSAGSPEAEPPSAGSPRSR